MDEDRIEWIDEDKPRGFVNGIPGVAYQQGNKLFDGLGRRMVHKNGRTELFQSDIPVQRKPVDYDAMTKTDLIEAIRNAGGKGNMMEPKADLIDRLKNLMKGGETSEG